MRDGDQFLEFNNFNGNDYGTSKKVVEGIIAQGKVPVMEMDMHVSTILIIECPHPLSIILGHSAIEGEWICCTLHFLSSPNYL